MKIRPNIGITTCYKCGKPMVKAGLSFWTPGGSVYASSRCICGKCRKRLSGFKHSAVVAPYQGR